MPGGVAKKYHLEERLLEFAAALIDVSESLPSTRAGNHISGQILRTGTSPYGNHGETHRWARLIDRKRWLLKNSPLSFVVREGDELIRIFKKGVQTAEANRAAKRRHRGGI